MVSTVKRHPLVTFFVLACGISWGSFLALSGPGLFPFGAILAAIIVAATIDGVPGLRDLLGRCLMWRMGPLWYGAALLVPLAMVGAIVCLALWLGAPMLPEQTSRPWYGLIMLFPMALVDAPLWEESAWRGFAMPAFPRTRSRLANTLLIGMLIALWHFPIAWSGGDAMIPYLIAAIGSAFVTNWVYYGSGESALAAILYHTSANTCGMFFFQMFASSDLPLLYWLLAAVNWAAAIIIFVIRPRFWLIRDENTAGASQSPAA